MSWSNRNHVYTKLARQIDPSIVLTTKDGWFWKLLAVFAMLFTFGGISRKKFLENYATTIGPIQAYPRNWPKLSRRLLIHEAQHTRQARWCGLGIHPWVGLPIFAVLYLLVLLPIGFAYFRWRFEINAERASYRWMLNNGYLRRDVRLRASTFGQRVCGGNYGWSWVIRGVEGFKKAAEAEITKTKT